MQSRPMTEITPEIQALIDRHYPEGSHPYRILESAIKHHAGAEDTVLDIGCGRTAPQLSALKGQARRLIGIDLVEFKVSDQDLRLINTNVGHMDALESASVDLSYSRSVMEHIEDVDRAYGEIARVLKPGGRYIFLTPSLWDYASLIAYVTPNSLHPAIVRYVEGRKEEDTFPTHYKSNTRRAIEHLAARHGFHVEEFSYLGQYPNYLVFSRPLFWLGCKYDRFLAKHKALNFLLGWIYCVLRKA